MLDALPASASARKLRLLTCAFARRVWHLLTPDARRAVEVAERFADGLADEAERRAAYEAAGGDWSAIYTQADGIPAKALVTEGLRYYCADAAASATHVAGPSDRYQRPVAPAQVAAERRAQCALIRDVFTDPSHSPALDPAWLCWNEGTVLRLAQGIYAERRWDELPVLGDALEDAGCRDEPLLAHCRGPGPHVLGCWALDLVLARG
jgi:hypothetical protein